MTVPLARPFAGNMGPRKDAKKTECPICEYPNPSLRYRMRDRFFRAVDGEFLLYRCPSCGLLFQREEGIRDCIEDFYPPGYWWRETGKLSALERNYREWVVRHDQLKFLLTCCAGKRGRLLDIGCGAGTFVKLAVEAGFDAFGLEQSEEAIKFAEREAPKRIFRRQEDLIEAGEQFEMLTLFHALEHMTDAFRYLKGLQKLLSKPGKLIVQVPNNGSWQARIFGSRWYGLDCPRHIYNYNVFSLLHLLGKAGYRVHRVEHFSLRDNSAALVSSLFPALDPMSQRVRLLKSAGTLSSPALSVKEGTYLVLFALAQPLAWLEAAFGRGATVKVYATWD